MLLCRSTISACHDWANLMRKTCRFSCRFLLHKMHCSFYFLFWHTGWCCGRITVWDGSWRSSWHDHVQWKCMQVHAHMFLFAVIWAVASRQPAVDVLAHHTISTTRWPWQGLVQLAVMVSSFLSFGQHASESYRRMKHQQNFSNEIWQRLLAFLARLICCR